MNRPGPGLPRGGWDVRPARRVDPGRPANMRLCRRDETRFKRRRGLSELHRR
jgi:hypothetical protein